MSLEIAAGTALEKVKELLPQIESSEQLLEQAAERIEVASGELEKQWEELQDYGRTFNERSQRRSHEIAVLQETQARQIERLTEEVEEVRDAIDGEQEETIEALRDLTDEADEAREELASVMERTEEQAERFEERMQALDERFERVIETLARFVEEDVESGLERIGDEIEESCERLRDVLREVATLVSESAQGTMSGMARLAVDARTALTEGAHRIEGNVTHVVGETVERLTDAASEVTQRWQDQAERALMDLEHVLEQGAEQVSEARARLEGAGHETGDGLGEVIEGVSGALEFFSRFSFL